GISFCLCSEKDSEQVILSGLHPVFTDSERKFPTIVGQRNGNLAYIMYTSGSTCQPKGVKIEHSAIMHYLHYAMTHYCGEQTENSGSYLHMPITFDAALTSLFLPLIIGKTLVISETTEEHAF